MNQFSVFEALDLSGLFLMFALAIFCGIGCIIIAIIDAHLSWSGWTGFNTFFLVLGLVGIFIIPSALGWLSYTSINTEYNKIMSVDENREYTAVEIYKEFGVEMPDGTYRIDLSDMDKELFSRIKREEKNPYDFITKKVPDDSDMGAK